MITWPISSFFYLNGDQYTSLQVSSHPLLGGNLGLVSLTTFPKFKIEALKRVTLARVLCETGEDFPDVPRNAFRVDDGLNAVPCSEIPPLDLSAWREG